MALKLGTADAGFGGADKAFLGANQVWAAASGPAYDPRVIHAWNPDAGGDASGQVAALVGGLPLYVGGQSGVVTNWNGELGQNAALILPDRSMGWYWGGGPFTISLWAYLNTDSPIYGHFLGCSDGDVFNSSSTRGSWMVGRAGGSNGPRIGVRTSYNAVHSSGSPALVAEVWSLLTVRVGGGTWRAIWGDFSHTASLSWLSEDIPDTPEPMGLTFGAGYGLADETAVVNSVQYMRGRMKDIRIWSGTLSDTEISALHAAGPLY